jgi:hypothetical protein
MTKFCRNGIRFFSRNIQKRARQYLTMQILVQTHIHTEHWFYRHIHKKSPLSCANKRNLSGPNLKVSSNRLHILGSLVSQRSQKNSKRNVPTLAFLLSRKKINKKDTSIRKLDLLEKKNYFVLQMLNKKKSQKPLALFF